MTYFPKEAGTNLLHNGAMQVAQRGLSTAGIITPGYHTADRWKSQVGFATWTNTVEADGPAGSGLTQSYKILCTANAAPTAAQYGIIVQHIEGQNLQHLMKGTSSAQSLTASFWVKSNKTGTWLVELFDNGNGRYVSASYTVVSSGVWEYKTVVFPPDTTGTIANTTSAGMQFSFWLAAGTNFSGGAGLGTTWAAADNKRAYGTQNLGDTIGNYLQVTGVQLEVGSTASPFQFKPYDQELQECQRYFQKLTEPPLQGMVVGATTVDRLSCVLPTRMRDNPVATITGTLSVWDSLSVGTFTSLTSYSSTLNSVEVTATLATGSLGTYRAVMVYIGGGGGSILLSADL